MRIVRLVAVHVTVLASVSGTTTAFAGSRVALVIGNSDYVAAGRLANPVNDARLVGSALTGVGFETTSVANASLPALRVALREFRAKANGAEIALVYFAGHGIEAKGKNWLLPTDARLNSEFDLPDEAVELDRIMETLAGAKTRIAILDACRNNPFGGNWTTANRSVTRGLGRVEVDDVLVIFAAAPGTTAADGANGNSPFARSLASRIVQSGLPVQMLGGMVRDDVLAATGGSQRPFISASITGTPIYLVGTGSPMMPVRPAPAPVPVPAQPAPSFAARPLTNNYQALPAPAAAPVVPSTTTGGPSKIQYSPAFARAAVRLDGALTAAKANPILQAASSQAGSERDPSAKAAAVARIDAELGGARAQFGLARAAATTPGDRLKLGNMMANYGGLISDSQFQHEGLVMMLDSGVLAEDLVGKVSWFAGVAAYQARDYATAARYVQRAKDRGFTDPQLDAVLADAYRRSNTRP